VQPLLPSGVLPVPEAERSAANRCALARQRGAATSRQREGAGRFAPQFSGIWCRGGATMEPHLDILQKIDEVNFRWLEAARDLQCAKSWIEERQALSPGEYVVFDPSTRQILARSSSTLRCPMVAPKD